MTSTGRLLLLKNYYCKINREEKSIIPPDKKKMFAPQGGGSRSMVIMSIWNWGRVFTFEEQTSRHFLSG